MKSKSTALLLQDHKRLLQVLNVLDEMAASAGKGQNLDETHVLAMGIIRERKRRFSFLRCSRGQARKTTGNSAL
jgi:hypothetical protein